MLPDLAGLVRVRDDYRVGFVVIGGVAVAVHGYVRATEDLDVVPDPDRASLDRLGRGLVSLDARLATDPRRELGPAERQALYRGRNLTLATRLGDVDVVQRLPGVPGYRDEGHPRVRQDRADLERLRPAGARRRRGTRRAIRLPPADR